MVRCVLYAAQLGKGQPVLLLIEWCSKRTATCCSVCVCMCRVSLAAGSLGALSDLLADASCGMCYNGKMLAVLSIQCLPA